MFEFIQNNWQSIITISISLCALVLSGYSIYNSRRESILSNRAYVGPATWGVSDDNTQFQISFINSGSTPATHFKIVGNIIIEGNLIKSDILADNLVLLPGLDSTINPKVPFSFVKEDIDKVIINSENSFIQIEIEYFDYMNVPHQQSTSFGVHNIFGRYQIQTIKQVIIK